MAAVIMNWFPFAILALAATVVQTTLVPYVRVGAAGPDVMFLLAVHYALWGPWPDVGIAAWILGLVFGTQSDEPVGLHAFCYGAAAWGIVRLRQVVFRDHPVAQFLIALLFTFLVQAAAWLALHWLASVRLGGWEVFKACVLVALYTAVCAPFLHAALHRLSRWTGLRSAVRAGR